ncbi:unnamed protein product [Acanthosepion pharaonis]|uniref:Uncharacterized protein n=1 Tax=Acanthosepion pharaonis TaxID=158019 RepID=A0A812DVJ5_ACAPH|nr:unnamed protein product [Sepia pharaonis]
MRGCSGTRRCARRTIPRHGPRPSASPPAEGPRRSSHGNRNVFGGAGPSRSSVFSHSSGTRTVIAVPRMIGSGSIAIRRSSPRRGRDMRHPARRSGFEGADDDVAACGLNTPMPVDLRRGASVGPAERPSVTILTGSAMPWPSSVMCRKCSAPAPFSASATRARDLGDRLGGDRGRDGGGNRGVRSRKGAQASVTPSPLPLSFIGASGRASSACLAVAERADHGARVPVTAEDTATRDRVIAIAPRREEVVSVNVV